MRITVSNTKSIRVVDATASRKGVILQSQDGTNKIFFSESERDLDAGNAGWSLGPNQAVPFYINVIRGALYALAATAPVAVEVCIFDVDDEVFPATGLERMQVRAFPFSNPGENRR